MDEALVLGVRFGQYVVLGLLFGLPAFALYGLRRPERSALPLRAPVAGGALIGVGLTILSMVLLAGTMAGMPATSVESSTLRAVLGLPGIGTASIVRVSALTVLATLAFAARSLTFIAAGSASLGGIALATLAWGGHAGASEGAAGVVHLIADIAHLLVAAAWLGALVGFLWLLRSSQAEQAVPRRALGAFATTGAFLVAVLFATGVTNMWMLVGDERLSDVVVSPYGMALLAKLTLFMLMLALAVNNRFRLAPQLAPGSEAGRGAIRRSVLAETIAALLILAIVAWLGITSP